MFPTVDDSRRLADMRLPEQRGMPRPRGCETTSHEVSPCTLHDSDWLCCSGLTWRASSGIGAASGLSDFVKQCILILEHCLRIWQKDSAEILREV